MSNSKPTPIRKPDPKAALAVLEQMFAYYTYEPMPQTLAEAA